MDFENYLSQRSGFLQSQIDRISQHCHENGGTFHHFIINEVPTIRMFFSSGVERKVEIRKKKDGTFNVFLGDKRNHFDKFNDIIRHLDEEL